LRTWETMAGVPVPMLAWTIDKHLESLDTGDRALPV
jgi:hypothetical protein